MDAVTFPRRASAVSVWLFRCLRLTDLAAGTRIEEAFSIQVENGRSYLLGGTERAYSALM